MRRVVLRFELWRGVESEEPKQTRREREASRGKSNMSPRKEAPAKAWVYGSLGWLVLTPAIMTS